MAVEPAAVSPTERHHMNLRTSTSAAVACSLLLSIACGGGSSSGATPPPTSGTVGGTVTGLASGASLVLRNNGGNDLVVSANGAFTFSTPMASGHAYAVTVLSQPSAPTQSCSVANGSGMMGMGNVTNVAVTCVTSAYSVGGTVIGLEGTGLALAMPGQANLGVAPGETTFTFPSPMPSGTAYAVTVASQPSSPAQTCTVGGGTGMMGGAHVTSVVVNCSTSQFLVGGTVSGLAGTGLVLSMAGQADLAVPAGATSFAFGNPMASGSAYAVTVKAQPTSPAQTCSVASGTGMMGSGNVTSVSVSCAYTVSGTVVKGPVGGATVTAYAVTNGTMGAQVGGGTTDSMGNFSISVGAYAGPMMLQASGGTYTDEATGTTMTMQAGDVMACAIPSAATGGTTTGIQVTPLTSMAHARVHHMAGGITDASIVAANADMGAYFSVSDILHTVPMDPMVAGSGTGATQDQKNYGMANAAMSQYAKSVGMSASSGMVTAMMDDASDGVMDGKMGGASITMGGGMMGGSMMQATAGTTGLATAMTAFLGSAMNRSGVTMTAMQPLVDKLDGASGQLSGGGGGTTTGMMSGTAMKGPVGGATVTAYAIANGMMGAQLGSAATDAAGRFSVPLGTYAGSVMLRMTGGTYADEATSLTMPMLAGDVLTACVPAVASGATTAGIQVTPLTSMAQARAKAMTGGMTDANIATANTAVGTYFSVGDPLHTMPMNPMATGSGATATQAQKNYGMSLAAMSQYAKTIGMMTSSSGVVTAMADDASDGVMDGMMGSTAISMAGMGGMMGGMMQSTAGTSGLSTAMGEFIGSTMNRSGVTMADMQSLMTQLSGSSGQLPGAGGGTTPQGTMTGTAFMGGMSTGTVTAYSVGNGTMGPSIGSSLVDGSGHFSIPLGAYAGTVMVQVTGGSFTDEATGSTMTMQAGDVITACVPSVAAGATTSGVQVTPLTSMAQAMAQGMAGGMTAANAGAANTAVGSYFMVGDILMTPPMDPSLGGSGTGASQDGKDYGMSIAAMSQYATSIGMTTSSSGVVTAMMKDASDGVMNGMMGSTSIAMGGMGGGMMGGGTMMQSTAGTTGLATAMTAYLGSSMNRSGVQVSDMQPLIDRLAASTGMLQ
jgi:hypothetical protein